MRFSGESPRSGTRRLEECLILLFMTFQLQVIQEIQYFERDIIIV